jgi:hypothetical protein
MKVENAVTVEPVGEFALKGIRRPLAAYNVLAVQSSGSTNRPDARPHPTNAAETPEVLARAPTTRDLQQTHSCSDAVQAFRVLQRKIPAHCSLG